LRPRRMLKRIFHDGFLHIDGFASASTPHPFAVMRNFVQLWSPRPTVNPPRASVGHEATMPDDKAAPPVHELAVS
jgi:hypothetical protein